MCLLMFACLPVYLLICLFIIWKWLYKLSMNMLLQIQIILFYISWFPFLFFLFVFKRGNDWKKNKRNGRYGLAAAFLVQINAA